MQKVILERLRPVVPSNTTHLAWGWCWCWCWCWCTLSHGEAAQVLEQPCQSARKTPTFRPRDDEVYARSAGVNFW